MVYCFSISPVRGQSKTCSWLFLFYFRDKQSHQESGYLKKFTTLFFKAKMPGNMEILIPTFQNTRYCWNLWINISPILFFSKKTITVNK